MIRGELIIVRCIASMRFKEILDKLNYYTLQFQSKLKIYNLLARKDGPLLARARLLDLESNILNFSFFDDSRFTSPVRRVIPKYLRN